MPTRRGPDCGLCAAVDVHYPRTGSVRAAAILAADAAFSHVLAEREMVLTPSSGSYFAPGRE